MRSFVLPTTVADVLCRRRRRYYSRHRTRRRTFDSSPWDETKSRFSLVRENTKKKPANVTTVSKNLKNVRNGPMSRRRVRCTPTFLMCNRSRRQNNVVLTELTNYSRVGWREEARTKNDMVQRRGVEEKIVSEQSRENHRRRACDISGAGKTTRNPWPLPVGNVSFFNGFRSSRSDYGELPRQISTAVSRALPPPHNRYFYYLFVRLSFTHHTRARARED